MARAIETEVGRLYVEAHGEGPVVLFWPSLFLDHTMWHRQIAALGDRYNSILVDGPGHGMSGPPPREFSQSDCAKAAFTVLEACARTTEAVVVVGCSWGGIVGVEMALSQPNRVAGLVLANTPLHAYRGTERMKYQFVMGLHAIAGTKSADATWRTFFAPDFLKEPAELSAITAGFLKADQRAMHVALVETLLHRRDLLGFLGEVRTPVLAVGGEQDQVLVTDEARRQAALFSNGRYVEIPRAGHVSPVEKPVEFNRELLRFLEEVTLPKGGTGSGAPRETRTPSTAA